MNELQNARNWFESLDLSTITEENSVKTDVMKYEVSLGQYKGTFYMVSLSPQQKACGRRSLGDLVARGCDKESLRSGFERFIAKMEQKAQRREDMKNAKRQARESFVNPYKVGDFLYSSWGYEQTNREFYQVLEVGNNSLKVREVAQNRERNHHDSGTCSPVKDSFIGEAKWLTIQVRPTYHTIPSPIHGNLYPYEGKPIYFSDGY